MVADIVDHLQVGLALHQAQTPTELLDPEDPGLGGAQHQHRVQGRQVDALVEHVDRADHVQIASTQALQSLAARVRVDLGVDGRHPQALLAQEVPHEARVAHRHAEGQSPRASKAPELLQGVSGPRPGGQGPGQFVHVEAVAPPGDVAVVHLVGDAVIVEGAQQAFADAVAHVAAEDQILAAQGEQVGSIGAVGGGRQTQQEAGLEPGQELPIGAGRRVMELVHHHVVEAVLGELLEVGHLAQGLDRGEDQVRLEVLSRAGVEPHARLRSQAAEGAQGLAQDLLAMGHEEHPLEGRRVEGGQPGLARAGGHHHQAGPVAFLPGPVQGLQGPALDRVGLRRWFDGFQLDGGRPPPGQGQSPPPAIGLDPGLRQGAGVGVVEEGLKGTLHLGHTLPVHL